jgi:hypothetical protein
MWPFERGRTYNRRQDIHARYARGFVIEGNRDFAGREPFPRLVPFASCEAAPFVKQPLDVCELLDGHSFGRSLETPLKVAELVRC